MNTRDFRSLSPQTQEDLRRKAVKAVMKGRTRQEVAELFGVTRQSVGAWVQRYAEKGVKALKAQRRGRRPGSRLQPWQAAQIVKAITDKHPEQLKMPFYLWTRKAVLLLIKKRFGIKISVWTAGRYLAHWGFTPQKPIRRAFEQDPEKVRKWLQQEYPAIRRQAKREKALIYWGDEMGARSDHAAGRSFSRKGQTPVVPGTGQRFGCNMISAITNRGQLSFMVFKERFCIPVFWTFLKRLVRQTQRKIFLIVDGHPVHRSVKIRKWLKVHRDHIRLFFLPGYSPELNPDEILNQDVKTNAVGRRCARNQSELISHVRGYLRRRQRQPQVVQNYFNEEHVRYAAM
jgi:transposase